MGDGHSRAAWRRWTEADRAIVERWARGEVASSEVAGLVGRPLDAVHSFAVRAGLTRMAGGSHRGSVEADVAVRARIEALVAAGESQAGIARALGKSPRLMRDVLARMGLRPRDGRARPAAPRPPREAKPKAPRVPKPKPKLAPAPSPAPVSRPNDIRAAGSLDAWEARYADVQADVRARAGGYEPGDKDPTQGPWRARYEGPPRESLRSARDRADVARLRRAFKRGPAALLAVVFGKIEDDFNEVA